MNLFDLAAKITLDTHSYEAGIKSAVAMGRDAKALKDAAFDYIFIGAGVYETNDTARHTLLHKQLEELGVKHDYYIGGFSAHDFMTWRHLLYFQFLPNLWK